MLELLATKHEDWIRIGYSMTGDMDKAKDLVQDMYIRLDRLGKTREDVAYRDTVNRYFIWTVMFNMYKVSMRAKVHKKIETCELLGNEEMEDFDYDVGRDNAFTTIREGISEIVSEWSQYDRKLFELYFLHGQSLRQIANGAGIGLNSIHNSVKGYKAILSEEISEDLQDYFNQDYDKIV
tara:strand:+ start:594 stop:1133 length:540 start_codon:yes stop_codon:yes gene_type:complete